MKKNSDKIVVAPSLLAASLLEIPQVLNIFQPVQQKNSEKFWLHLDVMDGHFVPNLTFGLPMVESIHQLNLQSKNKWKMDVHLMVTNPEFYMEQWQSFGIHHLTFHWESVLHHDRFIQRAKELYPSVGIALNPSTPWQIIPDYLLQQVDLILVMSVNPGFAGQKFISHSLKKIAELSNKLTSLKSKAKIQVDGGVSENNFKKLIESGARNFVIGSGLLKDTSAIAINKKLDFFLGN